MSFSSFRQHFRKSRRDEHDDEHDDEPYSGATKTRQEPEVISSAAAVSVCLGTEVSISNTDEHREDSCSQAQMHGSETEKLTGTRTVTAQAETGARPPERHATAEGAIAQLGSLQAQLDHGPTVQKLDRTLDAMGKRYAHCLVCGMDCR